MEGKIKFKPETRLPIIILPKFSAGERCGQNNLNYDIICFANDHSHCSWVAELF